jgi:hypothetical protein
LKEKQLWQSGRVKQYQSELTGIIRQYLEDQFQIPALEMTTDEVARALRDTTFDRKYEIRLKEILQMADLIKFAKANPDMSIHDQYWLDALSFVNDTTTILDSQGEDND